MVFMTLVAYSGHLLFAWVFRGLSALFVSSKVSNPWARYALQKELCSTETENILCLVVDA